MMDKEPRESRLYTEVSILLGDECVCSGNFLECDETCCPSDPDDPEYIGMCGHKTMTELKQVLDSLKTMSRYFDLYLRKVNDD